MSKLIDLHTHTTASDGSMSPRELVRHAGRNGLCAIAVTDHDTIDGLADALDEGERAGIEVIPGLEIGVDFKPDMHILAYFSKKTYPAAEKVLFELKKNRKARNPKIIKKLNEMGFDISMDEAEGEAKGGILGRPHIAKVLLRKGYAKSMEEAFDKYLSFGRPAYFKKDKLSPVEGIKEIIQAGGVPVLAHPIHLDMSYNQLDALLAILVPEGLRGIEAYYVDNTENDTSSFVKLAKKHGIIVTGGSDFHGSFKAGIEIGKGYGNLRIPYELLTKLKEDM